MGKIPEYVGSVLWALERAGHEAWCVGGCVRDLHLGRTPEDWDVTSSATPEEVMAVFGGCALPTGIKHGTVTVQAGRGRVEVTTFRKDGVYLDHRRPETVTFTSSLEEDLRRRDFTINAMAMDLRGALRDPFGGMRDLKSGVLRCVGDPDSRFQEDALRLLRGMRFAAGMGLFVEEATEASIHRNRELLREIAAERIWSELAKLLRGLQAARVLREYPDVAGVFWPEILQMVGFDQKNPHHCYDVWEHTLHALEAVPGDTCCAAPCCCTMLESPCAFILMKPARGHFRGHPACGAALAEKMLRRLKADNATRESVVRLVEWHDRDIPRTDRGLRQALRVLGEQELRRLLAVKRADNLAQAPEYQMMQKEIDRAEVILDKLLEDGACFTLRQLAVRGEDLLEMGFRGPAVGKTLEMLLDAVVNEDLPNERRALLEYARQVKGSMPV